MPVNTPRLLLFDIDQTLIHTAGAGLRCMARAVDEVTGIDLASLGIRPEGKTDPQILAETFEKAARTGGLTSEVEAEVWRLYARYLEVEMARPDPQRVVKPGVRALLEALQGDTESFLGLLTGNLEVTARIKLAPFDLDGFFPTGAFGSDSPDRCRLGAIALERARSHYGIPFRTCDVWVIGDTDRDIQAARALAADARVLAVATGSHGMDELQTFRPDAVLADLSDTAGVLRILDSR